MASPTTRDELILWVMKKLGFPVIEIEVDDDQYEDRLDEALQKYQESHGDATERMYLKHTVTQDEIDQGYIELPDYVTEVIRMLPPRSGSSAGDTLFDINYQIHLHSIYDLTNTSVIYYEMYKKHLRLLDMMFANEVGIEYNQHTRQLIINDNMDKLFTADESIIVIECRRALDPEEFTDIFGDWWLKKYFLELVREQWAQNLSKFEEIELPGGTKLNVQRMLDTAKENIEKLEDELERKYQEPPRFFVG